MVTKKRFHMIILALIFVVVLSACGSSNENDDSSSSSEKETKREAFSGNVKKIEYEDLIEKLDNEESFFLITMETTDEAFVDSGLAKAFDNALDKHGYEAYYLGFETMDEAPSDIKEKHVERNKKLKEYTHDATGLDDWYPRYSGFVYADEGKVMSVHKWQAGYNELTNIEWEDVKLLSEASDPMYDDVVKEIVDERIEQFEDYRK